MKKFINFTNHSSAKWSSEQLSAAQKYGEVVDFAFPQVAATATQDEIIKIARSIVSDICGTYDSETEIRVLVQGEMTLTYALVHMFHNIGIPCYAACSDRVTEEIVNPDGTTTKKATFKFVQFRMYPTF